MTNLKASTPSQATPAKQPPQDHADPPKGRWLLVLIGLAAVIGSGVLVLVLKHRHTTDEERETAERAAVVKAGPHALVAVAQQSAGERRRVLQGEAHPYATVTLYAKVSGYLKDIRVDKGDTVKADDVVAVIGSPEVDRQYQAALADAKNKRVQARRAKKLAGPGVVSTQEAEQSQANAEVADANLAALASQKSYEILHAPFAGTVTARFADLGALVQNATSAQSGALPVVTISVLDRLRIYVYLDQRDAAFVKLGDEATITLPERPGVELKGKVARLAGELDPKTRTMLAEVELDNRDRKVVPGSFVEVTLNVAQPRFVQVPSEALIVASGGEAGRAGKGPNGRMQRGATMVALLSADNRVSFQPVKVAADDGSIVQLVAGLEVGQRVALSLGNSVAEGEQVQPIEPAANPAPAANGRAAVPAQGVPVQVAPAKAQ